MKILSLHIDNFGKLSDFDIELNGGLNCIVAENGYGKTTLAAFIKAMLYGLPQTGKRSVAENERKHYLPWQGGVCGGTLDIETDKGRFRISRTFGKKASSDTFSLIDLETKLPSGAYTAELGTELFGIDSESYGKSTFVPQRDVDISMTSDIGAKLSSLLESSDDMGNLDDAVARLEEYSKRFKHYRGDGGLISENAARLAKTVEDINKCKRAEADAAESRAALEYVTSETKKCEKEIAELNGIIEAARAARVKKLQCETYSSYLEDTARAEERAARFEAALGGNVPDDTALNEMSELVLKLSKLVEAVNETSPEHSAIERMRERFGDVPPTEAELDSLSDKNKRKKEAEASAAEIVLRDEPQPPALKNKKEAIQNDFGCNQMSNRSLRRYYPYQVKGLENFFSSQPAPRHPCLFGWI